ncbi:MAG: hypothetical protein PUK83_03270 [Clostridia bacterium]|nr:hypothetical protein [Clostridia bacterium]MDY5264878.1 hypothetical protein [Eubacteriales bacterium]
MQYFDLEELFMKSVREKVLSDKEKYSNVKVIEKELMGMYLDWVQHSNEELDGFTPIEYVKIVDKSGNLFDYIEYMLNTEREVSDIVTDALVKRDDAIELVKKLLQSNDRNTLKYAFTVMFELDNSLVTDLCIDIIRSKDDNQEKIGACYEMLAEDNDEAVDKILSIMYEVDEDTQFIFADILSNYKNNENIFMWLVTMLYRGKDLCEVAQMLGRYGDNKAVNMINSFVLDKDLNYMEFIELRNAVERLGGEFEYEKDFSEDEYYKKIVTDKGKIDGNA